jgi:acyl dehydratase
MLSVTLFSPWRTRQEELYFEDFYPGQTFESQDSYWLTAKEIIAFGERYDPQPFHIDETAGQTSFFNGLADG